MHVEPQRRSWQNKESITGAYLSGRMQIPVPEHRADAFRLDYRSEVQAENNLKNVDVEIPLGCDDLCDRCVWIRKEFAGQ